MTTRHANDSNVVSEKSADPTLGSWYCGLNFLEKYRFGSFLRPNVPGDYFFRHGWIAFIDSIYTRVDRSHYDTNCKIMIHDKRYNDRDFFKLNVFYNYSNKKGNELIWPNFLELTSRQLPTQTKAINTLTVALETMRANGLTPKKLSKKFLGVGTVKFKNSEPQTLNIYSCEIAFYPTYDSTPPLSREHYPDAGSLKTLLTTIRINTLNSLHPRGRLFKDIIKNEIENRLGMTVQLSQKLRNQFVRIDEEGTVCDLFNTLASILHASWDWVNKTTIYFKAIEEM